MAKSCASIILALSCVAPAFGGQLCSAELAGETACVAGELMLCNKEFDAGMHAFKYEWHGINNTGQPFDIYYDAAYKQVPGLTPAACGNVPVAPGKNVPAQTASRVKPLAEDSRPAGNKYTLPATQRGNYADGGEAVVRFLFGGLFLVFVGVFLLMKRRDPAIGCARYRNDTCNKVYPGSCKYPHCEELSKKSID